MCPKWIWYPCEYELNIANKTLFRRDYRNEIEPPFWRVDNLYQCIFFSKNIELKKPEKINIISDSKISLEIAKKTETSIAHKKILKLPESDGRNNLYILPDGLYEVHICAYNENNKLPCIYIEGIKVETDESWLVSNVKHRGEKIPVGFYEDLKRDEDPNDFSLATKELWFENIQHDKNYILCDFGKETFGFVKFYNIIGSGKISLFYGESIEEAMDADNCETLDYIDVKSDLKQYVHYKSRAFRYIKVVKENGVSFERISVIHEYLPIEYKSDFRCSDKRIDNIYDVSLYTFHLNSRETFLDGIKRDRWFWSGDAYQSYMLNYYSFFDKNINRRTICALRGKGFIDHHINQIMDYTFFWFNSLYDHYLYMGDLLFIKSIFSKAVSLMDYCISLINEEGFIEGREKDWVFVDWAEMPKEGALSFEQILFYRSLWVMGKLSELFGYKDKSEYYNNEAEILKEKIFNVFYNYETGVFYHNYHNGVTNKVVTRYANIFAIMYGIVDEEGKQKIIENVLLNNEIQKIVTPYAMFYELVGLCESGKYKRVKQILNDYWGGMLDLGATTFWELFDPEQDDHLSMYGRPYGKSLCHAWSANPIYILSRYFLGVYPVESEYKTIGIKPKLGGLEWISGKVPTPSGSVEIYFDSKKVSINNNTSSEAILYATSDFIILNKDKYEIKEENVLIHPNTKLEIPIKYIG